MATANERLLTVVTYNIRAGIGPGPFPAAWWRHASRERLERIAEAIAALEPDLVSLQEVAIVTVDGHVTEMARFIAERTGLDSRYGAVGHFPVVDPESGETIGASFWGNAILSRLPVQASRTIGLPVGADDALVEPPESAHELAGVRYADAPAGTREPRCLLACELLLDGRPLHVVSTHLTHVGSGQRLNQAARVRAFIDERSGPVILAGDLNAPIESPELAPLREPLLDAFSESAVAPGDPRRASCQPLDANLGIDHVLVRGLEVASCRVARETGDASDHWPVVATARCPGADQPPILALPVRRRSRDELPT